MSRMAYSRVYVVMVGVQLAVCLMACGSTPTPIPPTVTPIPTPEIALTTYTSTQYPFAIQYPAEWPELPSEETVTAQYGGAFAGLALAEEDLVVEGLGETALEEYVDLVLLVLPSSLEDFELLSRREGVNEQGLPIQVIEFSGSFGVPFKASRLIYVHKSGIAFNATYFVLGDRYQEMESLIAYSFSTFEVTD